VLKIAAPADAIVGAGRRNTVGRGFQDGGGDGLREALLFEDDPGLDGFPRQNMADENDLAIFPAGQAVAAIDCFFNVELEIAHFFNDGEVDEVVFSTLQIIFLFFSHKEIICERR
jgi:hypothetical protein